MSSKSYKSLADIQNMNTERKQLVKTEYRSYDEYMDAQSYVHKQLHTKPAEQCELCGYAMDYNGHVLSEWETKWSIHEVCKKKMDNMLDRETGIARERKAMENRATGRRY
jgi:hypothetical protein